jgi:hypothetical protein
MQTFKLTPKPQNDYRSEVKEIKKKCKIEKHGYRHNKIVYGFCDELLGMIELQSLGLNIEEIPFDEAQLKLIDTLLERGRIKSKIDRLQLESERKDAKNDEKVAEALQNLTDLNNNIQSIKEILGITGILKILNF